MLAVFGDHKRAAVPGGQDKVREILCKYLAACQPDDNSWDRVQESGVLKVGLDPTYPPFEVIDGDSLHGFDVDLADSLAKDLGLQIEYLFFGYDGLYDALATRQVDVLISALVILPEKRKDFAYSDPYFNAGEILIIPSDDREISGMADLNGRILAVELGALGHVEATTWEKKLPDLTIEPYPTADEALTAVKNNEVQAALIDAISGQLFISENPDLSAVSPAITVEPFAIVTRIEDEKLLDQLNSSLARLQENGQFEEIYHKWFRTE